MNEPEMGTEIDPGMAMIILPSSIGWDDIRTHDLSIVSLYPLDWTIALMNKKYTNVELEFNLLARQEYAPLFLPFTYHLFWYWSVAVWRIIMMIIISNFQSIFVLTCCQLSAKRVQSNLFCLKKIVQKLFDSIFFSVFVNAHHRLISASLFLFVALLN